jgi:transcriptional regulator with XRE-family HTH domain
MRGLEIAEKHLGMEELCRRLGTTTTTIEAWRLGHVAMPDSEFLRLVDLLMDLDPGWMSPPKP